MKTFIYGRPAPEMGDRGYRIFEDNGLSKDEIDALHLIFSSEDPDTRKLRKSHQEPFCLSMPFKNQWLFGIGRIEVHGTFGKMYHSYLFHGCLIDAETLQDLQYNPFLLSDYLIPKDGQREILPQVSQLSPKARTLAILKMLRRLSQSSDNSPENLTSAGYLATHLGHGQCQQRISYEHLAHWNHDIWGLVLFLLPQRVRQKVTIISWSPFLKEKALVHGIFEDQQPPDCQRIDPRQIGSTPARQILQSFATDTQDEEETVRKIEAYQLARDDWPGMVIDNQFQTFVTKLIQAVRRPSINALKLWPPVKDRLFPLKADHFRQVWLQHRQDSKQAEQVAPLIWQGLSRDADDIRAMPGVDLTGVKEELAKVFDMIQHYLSEEDIQRTFKNPVTARLAVQHLNIDRFIKQLKDLDGQSLLTHLINRKQFGIPPAQFQEELTKVITWFFQELIEQSSKDIKNPQVPKLWDRLDALAKHGKTKEAFNAVVGPAIMRQKVESHQDPDWLVFQITQSTPAGEAMLHAWYQHFQQKWEQVKFPNKNEQIPPHYVFPLCRMALAARNLYHNMKNLEDALPGLFHMIDGHFTLKYVFQNGPTQAWPHASLELQESS